MTASQSRGPHPSGQPATVSRNSAWLVVVSVFVSIVQLICVRFLYRWLGEESYAVYVLVISFVNYVTLFIPSVQYGVQKRLTEAFHTGDLQAVERYQGVQASIVAALGALGVVILLGLGLAYNLPGAHLSRGETLALFSLGAVVFVAAQINQLLVPILASLELFKSLAMRTACEKLASGVLGVVFAYWFKSPVAVLAGTAIGSFVSVGMNIASLRRAGCPYRLSPSRDREELEDLTRFGKQGYAHRTLGALANSSDRLLYGYSGRPIEELSRYSVAYRVPEMIQMMFIPAAEALVPRLTRELAHEPEAAGRSLDRAGRFMFLIGLSFVMVPCAFGAALLKAWLGQVPPGAAEAMALLGVYFTFQMYVAMMSKAFHAAGLLHKAAYFTAYNAAVTVFLTIPAARWNGIVGVSAMNAAIAVTQFIPYAYWIRRECIPSFDVARHVRATLGMAIIGGLFAGVGYYVTTATTVGHHRFLCIALAILFSVGAAALMSALRLAEIPRAYTNRIVRILRRTPATMVG